MRLVQAKTSGGEISIKESQAFFDNKNTEVEISDGKTCKVQVRRKVVVTTEYISETNAQALLKNDYWGPFVGGGKLDNRYITVGLKDYCYGEKPEMEAWVKIVPMQFSPLPEMSMSQYDEITQVPGGSENERICTLEGRFDVKSIDYSLCFEKEYILKEAAGKVGMSGHEYATVYEPVLVDRSAFDDVKQFRMVGTIMQNGKNIIVEGDPVTVNDPVFRLLGVRIGSSIALDPVFDKDQGSSRSINFYPVSSMGIIEEADDLAKIKIYSQPIDNTKYSITVTRQLTE